MVQYCNIQVCCIRGSLLKFVAKLIVHVLRGNFDDVIEEYHYLSYETKNKVSTSSE